MNGRKAACRILIKAGAKVDALTNVRWHSCDWMLYEVFKVCDLNGVTAAFFGRLDRALGRMRVCRLYRR